MSVADRLDVNASARPCPSCGSTDAVPIVYGYPTAETFEAADLGEVTLGGCIVGDESPDYQCRGCETALPWVAVDDDVSDPRPW